MLMRMGAALVLLTFIGQSGVFFAEGAAWVCAAALNLVWYYMRIGKIKRDMLNNKKTARAVFLFTESFICLLIETQKSEKIPQIIKRRILSPDAIIKSYRIIH
ncbi:MAG: hypothetical protein ACLVFS_00495 [Butyricicoccus sp.]